MSKSTRGIRAAGIASLAVSLSIGVAAPAFAVADFKFDRIGGADRYETSTLVDDEFRDGGADVILANGQPGNYADALSANTLAGEKNIPILLTRKDETPASVLQQLKDDAVKNIWVVGGTSVVSDAQVASLTAAGYTVTRVSGADRFGTNNEIIKMSGAAAGNTGLVATGFNFPDALAAGPFSFQGHPLALSTKDSIEDSTVQALKDAGVTKVLIFGGTTVVTPAVEAKLKAAGIDTAARFAGADRSDTSEQAAEYAVKNLGFTNTHVGVASGYVKGYGADALAGGPLEGKEKSPMLVTRDVDNPDDVLDYLKAHAATLKSGHIYGGTAAVSAAAQAAMEKAAQSVTSNQTFAVTPQSSATLTRTANPDTTTADDRQYSVAGLDNSKTYSVALFLSSEVTTGVDGQTKFADANGDNKADRTAPTADITVVNGAPSAGGVVQVSPVNGTINFTVDGDTANETIVPVIWLDTANTGVLDLTAPASANNDPKAPSEAFGVGGATTYAPAEAGTGDIGANDIPVTGVDKDGNAITTAAALYKYDSNDTFYVRTADSADNADNAGTPGEQVTMAEFEKQLSVGDQLDASTFYQKTPELPSTFVLEDVSPAAPQSVDAVTQSNTSIKVTWSAPTTGTPDSYNVYRATKASPVFPTDYTKVGTVAGNAATLAFTDTGLTSNTTYTYAVTAVQNGDESAAGTDAATTNAGPADTTAPTLTDARIGTDGGLVGVADTTDTWFLTFSEQMNASTTSGTFRVQDADGTIDDVVCGTAAATCVLQSTNKAGDTVGTGRVLKITLGTLTAPEANGTTPGLQYPLTITNVSANVADNATSPNTLNLSGSADKVVDNEA